MGVCVVLEEDHREFVEKELRRCLFFILVLRLCKLLCSEVRSYSRVTMSRNGKLIVISGGEVDSVTEEEE